MTRFILNKLNEITSEEISLLKEQDKNSIDSINVSIFTDELKEEHQLVKYNNLNLYINPTGLRLINDNISLNTVIIINEREEINGKDRNKIFLSKQLGTENIIYISNISNDIYQVISDYYKDESICLINLNELSINKELDIFVKNKINEENEEYLKENKRKNKIKRFKPGDMYYKNVIKRRWL